MLFVRQNRQSCKSADVESHKDGPGMNRIWVVVGALAVLVGLVFFFQGIGALKGSSMTGDSFWMWVGLILVVAGGLVLFRGLRSGQRGASR